MEKRKKINVQEEESKKLKEMKDKYIKYTVGK
jgi:hypothetical protein